jgi:hypothetical protein
MQDAARKYDQARIRTPFAQRGDSGAEAAREPMAEAAISGSTVTN